MKDSRKSTIGPSERSAADPSSRSRNCEGVIYSPAEQCWFLAEGKGLTPNRREAHVYSREHFDYMYGPHTKLEFQPLTPSEKEARSVPAEDHDVGGQTCQQESSASNAKTQPGSTPTASAPASAARSAGETGDGAVTNGPASNGSRQSSRDDKRERVKVTYERGILRDEAGLEITVAELVDYANRAWRAYEAADRQAMENGARALALSHAAPVGPRGDAYKRAYQYLQGRLESIGYYGWAHDMDGEIEDVLTSSATAQREPTPDMCAAGGSVEIDYLRAKLPDKTRFCVGMENAERIYKAMIAAAESKTKENKHG
jgi:hypothetical protein